MPAESVTAAQRRFSNCPIPDDWEAIRLGRVFSEVVDTGHSRNLPVLAVTMHSGVVRRDSLDRRFDREVDRATYRRVVPGDIAYNTMRMWQGASGLVSEEGYVSPAYTVTRPGPREHGEFWAYYFKDSSTVRRFLDHSQGFAKDRYRLYFRHFATVPALRPPYAEQRKIAAVLSSVDKTIEATQAVIEQTQRVRQGLVEELLTRGIGCTEFRATAIGSLPASWAVKPLGEIADVAYGLTVNKRRRESPARFPYLRVANVRRGGLDLSEVKSIGTIPGDTSRYSLREGDILCVEGHANPAELGRCAIWTGEIPECLHQNHLLRARPHSIGSRFLCSFLNSRRGREHFSLHCKTSSGLNTLNSRVFGACLVPVPRPEEQSQITAAVDSLERRLRATREAASQLARLKRGLMQDLLTGRLRVPLSPEEVAAAEAEAAEAAREAAVEAASAPSKPKRRRRRKQTTP